MGNFDLKLGFYCCQDCVHCVVTDSRKYGNLSFDQVCYAISNIPKSDNITLTGGEPTLRPDFMKIMRLCKEHKSISIQTNGLGLTEEVCRDLRQFNLKVLLTVHSCNKEIYLKVSRGPEDGYDKAVQAARNLTKYDIPFIWQIVVHKLNKDTVIETFRLAKSINPSIPLKFTNPHPMGNAYTKKLLCTLKELSPLVKNVCAEFRNSIWFEMVPFCFLDGYEDIMKRSSPPIEESLGLRFENNLNIRPYNMKSLRIKNKQCNKCIYYAHNCPGIYIEYKELFGDKELAPVTLKNRKEFFNNSGKNYMYQNFGLWVFTTSRCNCNCEYCKQANGDSELRNYKISDLNFSRDMTGEDLKYILNECVKSYEKGVVKKFNINLSGGEPYLVFKMFSAIVSDFRKNYPDIFNFSTSTNGLIVNDEIIRWVKNNLSGGLFSMDSLVFSKPINGISSSNIQIENVEKLNSAGIKPHALSVFENQTVDEMVAMAEFAIKHFDYWRILLATPSHHTKEKILGFAKPVLKYL